MVHAHDKTWGNPHNTSLVHDPSSTGFGRYIHLSRERTYLSQSLQTYIHVYSCKGTTNQCSKFDFSHVKVELLIEISTN